MFITPYLLPIPHYYVRYCKRYHTVVAIHIKEAVEEHQWLVGKGLHAVRVVAHKQGRVNKNQKHDFCS